MKYNCLFILALFFLCSLTSCSQNIKTSKTEKSVAQIETIKEVPHNYGGWYCPDNLNGFPAVNIGEWQNVPVINGRMATEEETRNGSSLIFVDAEKYPNAKPLELKMPKLARFYNNNSRKEELVIVIQALNISNDSIVGFRYLNGGNGSARMDKVNFLSTTEIENLAAKRFVTLDIKINATKAQVWDVLTNQEYSKPLQAIFDSENKLKGDWSTSSKVNFIYHNGGIVTSEFAGNLYGNQYIQIDCGMGDYQYVEKFLVSENEETKASNLQIVCGPYGDDFMKQKVILNNWSLEVKAISEGL